MTSERTESNYRVPYVKYFVNYLSILLSYRTTNDIHEIFNKDSDFHPFGKVLLHCTMDLKFPTHSEVFHYQNLSPEMNDLPYNSHFSTYYFTHGRPILLRIPSVFFLELSWNWKTSFLLLYNSSVPSLNIRFHSYEKFWRYPPVRATDCGH